MKLAPFRAVIFDCDGVLVESENLGLRSLQLALQDAGVDRPLGMLTRFSGRSHHETLAELETECGLPLRDNGAAGRMDEHYMNLVKSEGLHPCSGVPQLLCWLTANHIPFSLASSGPRRKVLFSLESAGLSESFPHFICGDDVTKAKPAPDPYLAAAALVGVNPADCLAIEDAPNGIRSALAAGMQVVAVTTTFKADVLTDADLVVDSLSDLANYFNPAERLN